MIIRDPIHAAIQRHRAAYDALQTATDGTPALIANDEYDAATDALVSTGSATRPGALALLQHLRWWLAEEAPFAAGYRRSYDIAKARAADLSLYLGAHLPAPSGIALSRPGIPTGPVHSVSPAGV